jgi:hypothetical protein
MIVMWDEFYKLELSRNGGRIYCYENFNENNAFVYDALKYCGITSTEVKELKRNLSMQRTSADITRIKELKRYLDGIC